MSKKVSLKPVIWLGGKLPDDKEINHQLSNKLDFYEKFKFGNIEACIGDFVLVSNADAAEPDTEEGCDAALIVALYENVANKSDPYRAKVQWYSRPSDLPPRCLNDLDVKELVDYEVVEDHRQFDTDVSIETFFKKCYIQKTFTNIDFEDFDLKKYHYICRYRLIPLSKRKFKLEPVLEQERNALSLLATPKRNIIQRTPKVATPKTPNSISKKMGNMSIADQNNWSVSKADGTKMLLKRAIFSEKNEKSSPNTVKLKFSSPSRSKKLQEHEVAEILSMELEENSDDELPTLIIKQSLPTTPKKALAIKNFTPSNVKSGKKIKIDDNLDVELKENLKDELPTLIIREHKRTPVKQKPINNENLRKSTRTPVKSIKYYEDEMSPIDVTPKKSIKKRMFSDRSDDDFIATPKSKQTSRNTSQAVTPKRSVAKRILTNTLTPTLHKRTHSIDKTNVLEGDRSSLPGRESQMDEILSFVRTKLLNATSGCMYISGVPGTGKTATVCAALQILKEEAGLPNFQLVEVNGMKIAEPRQAYVQIYKQLTGKSVAWEQSCTLLEKRFTNPGPRRTPTVLLVDELDALCTRRQDVLYSIMEWSTHNTALLTVLAVANTMDLPERALVARVASRLGLTRLTFPPYTHVQLQNIVATRLTKANVTADAVELIARKVAAVSGDARRALALCERALELAGDGPAGLVEVQRALTETSSSATVRAIKHCSGAEKLMLRAIASEVERTGSDETTLSRALIAATAIVVLEGRPYKTAVNVRAPTHSQAQAICSKLAASKLLLVDLIPADLKILLNVSADDVHYATRAIYV